MHCLKKNSQNIVCIPQNSLISPKKGPPVDQYRNRCRQSIVQKLNANQQTKKPITSYQ